jgi:hypothetical protein
MSLIKNNSSQFSRRKPYEPVRELFQIPVALYEVLSLVEQAEGEGCQTASKMKPLLESIIETALYDPEAWLKIEGLTQDGFEIAFVQRETPQFTEVEK